MAVTDRDVERLGAQLGARAAARIDVERVAASVTARLRAAGGPVRVRSAPRWLAMAAGIALIASAGWLTFSRDATPPALGAGPGPIPGLGDLTVTELHQVLDSLMPPVPAGLGGRGTLDDLDAEQLETLLTLMEG